MTTHAPHRQASGSGLYTLLVFVSIMLVLIVVILSAWLRLSGSGLGCTEWPSCYALIKTEISGAESLAAAHLVPPWATLTHRLVASALGVLVLGIVVAAWRRRRQPGQSVLIPLAVLGLTVFLSVLGYKTPSPLLPWVTLSNLLGGMAMLAMLWWLGQRSVSTQTGVTPRHELRPWALLGIFVVFFQIALGGWVSANFAALACTDLPGCAAYPWTDGPWRESFNLARVLPATDAGAVITGDTGKIIHLAHRAGAVLTFLYMAWLGWRALGSGSRYRSTGIAMLVFLALQISLGIGAIATSLPLSLVTAHNAVAALLLLSVVNLYHLLTPRT
ncbi:cytochrome oxidase assembly protein [Sulfuricaulis limicola]|uniref:Cytochrome oxidase assembly protein n=1 Tax=Sulfuricaulis limicola TaxID=1620215 RepID=A0A1B4XCN6_9GAMM|nr:COX15/CtaA family protein [Sulfuricaulis limicola]BAV32569.1 cytochrome oxidase assembly protein [Sulfuricaulis limicola]